MNVLAHPSPTTARFLLLMGVLLGSGLMAGQHLYLGLFAEEYAAELAACGLIDCASPQLILRAVFGIAGAAVIAGVGLVILAVTPAIQIRRRRLRPAGSRLEAALGRVAELAAEAGIRRTPTVLIGPTGQRDAFVFGLPGSYRLVLPTALLVRWRSAHLFDPVVRHELAHLSRHDVPLAWLAASIWLAAIPVLALPLLSAVVRLDAVVAWNVLWQSALVLAVVWLLRRETLRSREHDADLLAAKRAGDWRPLWTTLQVGTGRPASALRQLISNHPSAARRMEVLADPSRLPAVSFVDGLAAAFLTALLFPVLVDTLEPLITGSTVWIVVALIVGPVLGVAVGAGLWRQATVDSRWPGGVVFGVVAGLVLGHLINFGGLGVRSGWNQGLMVFLMVVVGAGAVLLSAGTGRVWADRRPSRAASILVNALIFGFALWAINWTPVMVGTGVETGLSLEVFVIGGGALIAPVALLAAVPAGATAYALRARRFGAVLASGLVPGLFAAFGLLVHRLVVGSPVDDDDRISRYLLWVTTCVLVALAVSTVTLIAVPRSGPAIGLLNGLVAAASSALGILTINTFGFGNPLILSFWWTAISSITAIFFCWYLLSLPIALMSWPGSWREPPGWVLVTIGTVAGGLTSLLVVGVATAAWQV